LTQRLTFQVKTLNQALADGNKKHHLFEHVGNLRDDWRANERVVALNQG